MNYNNLHYQTGLNLLHGVGPRRAKELLSLLESIDLLYHESPAALSKKTGFTKAFFERMKRSEALEESVKAVAFHSKKGIRSHFFTDASFPDRLRHCDDGPVILYSLGDLDLNSHRFVSIVGTRDCTVYGRDLCEELISGFIDKNVVVVSGLAYGIDSWAHYYSLVNEVPTIAVLGHGLDRIYPAKNREMAKEIVNRGMLLSEFIPGTNPDKENFPKRNRIVAGLCDATIVVESKATGGSLITAMLANDYNRDVFAFPGNIHQQSSLGCNTLIRNHQAQLLDSPESFLNQMGWLDNNSKIAVQRKVFPHLSSFQQEILSFMEQVNESQIEIIALHLKKSISELNVEMLHLEIEGAVMSLPGNRYRVV